MVNGLLSELEDHNCWTLAEAAGHASPYRMQHLLSRARVDERQLLDAAADWAAAHLTAGQDEDDVVLIVDETADEKSSADCAGAARQYSGTVGGIAMCQVAVTLTCASPAGHTLIGRALYLPADWAADEERRELAGVPDEIMFATKPQLAGDLLQHAHDRGIRAGFTASAARRRCGAAIPFDLGPINVLTYDESLARWTLDEEVKRLAEHVSNVPTDSESGNAMWQYFGLTKRGGPAEAGSMEAKVNLLLAEVTKLRLAPAPARLGPDMPAAEQLFRFKSAIDVLVDNEAEFDDYDVRIDPATGKVDVILFGRLSDQLGGKISDIAAAQGIRLAHIFEGPLLPDE